MRTEKSIKNIKYSLIGQVLAITISMISRFFFLQILNSTYLGVNGLFSNILTMLSFIELGIGPALTFSLYEPLKKGDKEKTKTLLQVFKKSYRIVGLIIIIFGLILTPFLPKLINDLNVIPNINLIYWLFVINTGVSYFGSYKKTFLLSDQKGYVTSQIHYIIYFTMNLFQIVILYATKNFIFYLIIQIIFTVMENIIIALYVNKQVEYQFLKEKNVQPLDNNTKNNIIKNIKAMIIHKFGSVLVTATDNLILSKYIGLIAVGIYSNYYLIINNVHKILKQSFNSVIASVGNLGVEGNKEKTLTIFKHVNFINYYLQSISGILMLVLFQDFITIWLGKNYLFSFSIVVVLVLCFYFSGLRISVLLFKEALGLYWQDRYKAFFEAIINLVVSIILAKKVGVIGVFIGTLISTLATCFWVEPYVLYKYGFGKKCISYFKDMFIKTTLTISLTVLCLFVCSFFVKCNILIFIIKAILCFAIVNVVYIIIFRNSDDYKYVKMIIKNKILKLGDKNESK